MYLFAKTLGYIRKYCITKEGLHVVTLYWETTSWVVAHCRKAKLGSAQASSMTS